MGRGQGGGGGRGKIAGGGAATATLERAGASEYVDPGIVNDTINPNLLGQPFIESDEINIADYTGLQYYRVNAFLEGYSPNNTKLLTLSDLSPSERKLIDALPESLSKLPASPGVSYRTLGFVSSEKAKEYASQFVPGQGANFKGFLSTTKDKRVFGNDLPGTPSEVYFVIKGKRGRYVADYSSVPSEKEVLFTRGSKFVVNKVFRRDTGAYEIHLEQ